MKILCDCPVPLSSYLVRFLACVVSFTFETSEFSHFLITLLHFVVDIPVSEGFSFSLLLLSSDPVVLLGTRQLVFLIHFVRLNHSNLISEKNLLSFFFFPDDEDCYLVMSFILPHIIKMEYFCLLLQVSLDCPEVFCCLCSCCMGCFLVVNTLYLKINCHRSLHLWRSHSFELIK